MKKILKKINVLGLGLIVAGGLAIGTQSAFTNARTLTNKVWGYEFIPANGSIPAHYEYVDLTGLEIEEDYNCDISENLCTEEYPELVNPNDQANDAYPGIATPVNRVDGDFYFIEN